MAGVGSLNIPKVGTVLSYFRMCTGLIVTLRNPYLKILDLEKPFVADAPMKKNPKFLFCPLTEQFEIWI